MVVELVLSVLRHALTGVGSVLVTKGFAANDVETATGAILTLVGIAWSFWRKWQREQQDR